MQALCVIVFLLAVLVDGEDEVDRPKRAYTMVDYICHKQPYLSICSKRSLRASPQMSNKVNADPYDPDPMPTPGPLPLGDLKSGYDVARRREQEEPKDVDKSVNEEKPIRTRVKNPVEDEDMLTTSAFEEQTETTTTSAFEEQNETTTPAPERDQTTVQPLNPRLRYQQYERALQEYYRKYPNYQQYYGQYGQQPGYNYYQNPSYNYGQQSGYNYQNPNYNYAQQQYTQQYTYPRYTYQQMQNYQQYYPNQPNYYQPNGFNFGIGSQLQLPFTGPLGISTGFGFGGR